MASNYATSSDIYVVMVKTPQYQCANYDILLKVDALELILQQLPGVESTNSLAKQAKISAAGMNEGSMLWYGIPRSQELINSIISRAPRELFKQYCDLLTVYVYLKDHKADTLDQVVQAGRGSARSIFNDIVMSANQARRAGQRQVSTVVNIRS